ncbi:hypothetical protein ACRCQH_02455, partial [Pseudomonas aeruginosa]
MPGPDAAGPAGGGYDWVSLPPRLARVSLYLAMLWSILSMAKLADSASIAPAAPAAPAAGAHRPGGGGGPRAAAGAPPGALRQGAMQVGGARFDGARHQQMVGAAQQ